MRSYWMVLVAMSTAAPRSIPGAQGQLLPLEALRQGPLETVSATRAQICLNGLWRFMPAVGAALPEPRGEWGQIWVPGSWKKTGALPGLAVQAQGWAGFPGDELGRAWYERSVHIPADWGGRAILLDLRRVSTDALVYANGRLCGRVAWPYGEVDLTAAVQPGEEAALRILVAATSDEAKADALLAGEITHSSGDLETRGLIGDVLLVSRPAGAHIRDVFVQTSVRKGELALEVELAEVPAAGEVSFVARLLDEQGREERRFTSRAVVQAAQRQAVRLSWSWPDPRRWDLEQPNLYTLRLQAQGVGLDDEISQVFGFREFRIEGKHFLLNEREIRLRPINVRDQWNPAAWAPEAIANMIDAYLQAGFNLGEQWPWDADQRGTVHFRELWAQEADRRGWLLAGAAVSMAPYILSPSWQYHWNDERRARYEERMIAELRRLRNHPSIVMWASTANFFGLPQDQNPLLIGRRGMRTDRIAAAGRDGIALLKQHDPTRPVFTHQGADVGDVHTVNCYLCLTPLQEREEWLSEWARSGDLPFLPIEMGTPIHATFMRGRNGFGDAVVSEPLMTEFCAVYLGEQAYWLEPEVYRRRIVTSFQGGQRYRNWHGAPELQEAPAFQAVQSLFIRNTWRSWRTWGLTGGMVPWEMAHGWIGHRGDFYTPVELPFQPGRRGPYFARLAQGDLLYLQPRAGWAVQPAGQALVESNGPTLAWIAGPPEAFTAKDHLFESGELIQKQAVLINDRRQAQPYRVRWQVDAHGVQVRSGEQGGEIGPATTLGVPIAFPAPELTVSTDCVIRLSATIGDREHTDEFSFRVQPRAIFTQENSPLRVFDPEGKTSELLQSVGLLLQPWDGRATPGELVIIGRHALDGDAPLPGSLEEHVAGGGRLILFGQDPEWLRRAMGLRVARHVSRRFFPLPSQADHPIVRGLDAEDLRDWRGAGTLVAERWGGVDESPGADPPFGWHWGNRGSVSSAAIEKPHHSGWTPLLEGEFDLAYSPLMELHYGRGLAFWCTLDLEGRTEGEPLARRLARNLVGYARKAEVKPRLRTVCLGDETDERLMRRLGLVCDRVEALPAEPALAVIGTGAALEDDSLRAFLQQGGRALLLPRPAGGLPWGARSEERAFGGSLEVPAWEECRGLSASDLRLRAEVQASLLAELPGGETGAGGLLGRVRVGQGVALFLQLTPDLLNARERTYLRYSAWRLERVLAQLLANLGASFEMDARSLQPGWHLTVAPPQPAGDELLRNPDFGQGLEGWSLFVMDPAQATAGVMEEAPTQLPGRRSVRIDVTRPSETAWHVFLSQSGLSIRAGANYLYSFWAKADRPCVAVAAIEKDHDPFGSAGLFQQVNLSREWKLFRLRFTPEVGDDKVRFSFQELARQQAVYWFAAPSFIALAEDEAVVPPAAGLYHPDYLEGQEKGDDPYRYYRW